MIGPTGVGKTEIARRLAKLASAPFLKVEATKFTEVGYVGRDVESIVRDLVGVAIGMTRDRMRKAVHARAELAAEDGVIDALVGETASEATRQSFRRSCAREAWTIRRSRSRSPVLAVWHAVIRDPRYARRPDEHDRLGRHARKGFPGSAAEANDDGQESHEMLVAEEADKLLDRRK